MMLAAIGDLMVSDMRKTMVFLTPCIPDIRGVGWEQRAFSFLASYARLYKIILWVQATDDNRNLKRLQGALDLVEAAFSFDAKRLPLDPAVARDMARDLEAADLVHVFRLDRILENLQHPRIVWDFDELPPPLREPGRNAGGPAPATMSALGQYRRHQLLRRYARCWKTAKVVIAASPEERHPRLGNPIVVPNVGVLADARVAKGNSREILFVGNLNKSENLGGIAFFIEKCMPHLPPDVSLTIVGRSPKHHREAEFVRAASARQNVTFVCDVDSCEPFYHRAQLAIVPLQHGAGTKLKLLEAFGQHCPVVTTTRGIEGLGIIDGREALVRDDPADFAAACRTLLVDHQLSADIARNAYQLVRDKYSQQHVDHLLRNLTEQIL